MRGKPGLCSIAAAAAFSVALAGFLVVPAAPGAAGPVETVKQADGPEMLLDRREGSDLVCVMVAVNAGSGCETPDTRGATHFIEHLAFDGSARYTREEISGWVDDVGGFLNAFTRKEATVFFLLVPSVHFEKGVEILSQMLIHSAFLPEEIEKERKVIAEEIRRERDDPRAACEGVADARLYAGSDLTEPVIGYPETIETMRDSALISFYRRYYRPANMRIVVTGNFDPAAAERIVGECFPGSHRATGRGGASVPAWSGTVAEDSCAGGETGFDMLVPFPSVGEEAFPAALLVARMLEGESSPLAEAFKALSLPAPETGLEIHRGFAALRIHVGAAAPGDSARGAVDAYRKIPAALEGLADWTPSAGEIDRARVSFLSGEMFDREMYHFYVMSRGYAIALHGARYLSQVDAAAGVTAKECAAVIEKAFRPLRFNACLVEAKSGRGEPMPKSGPPGMPSGMPKMSGMPPRTPKASGPPPGTSGAMPPAAVSVHPRPCIDSLPNGCTVAAVSRPGSPVAALHLMFRGRACAEGGPPTGLAELLVTLLENSVGGKALAEKLDALGARIQFGDNPYMPQDDYLLNPSFAFVRLEAPAKVMREASHLLLTYLLGFEVGGDDLDAAKQSLAREVGMRSTSSIYTMRTTMMEALFRNHPFAKPMFPPPGPLMRMPMADLTALRARIFTGRNLIATLVSPETAVDGCAMLKELLAGSPAGAAVECPSIPEPPPGGFVEKSIRKEGAYIAAGWLARTPAPSGTASLMVAGEVLSRRMQLELREKQGLSYSIECGVTPYPGGAAVIAYLGTGPQRIDAARASLEREIRGLVERPPDEAEIGIAKNRLLGKRGRSELSSINAAYALGFDLLLLGDLPYQPIREIVAVAAVEDVRAAVVTFMAWDRAIVLKLVPEAAPGK